MGMNRFVWADLSTCDVDVAADFYSAVFGWRWQNSGNDGNDGNDFNIVRRRRDYYYAIAGDESVAGLYEMPRKFAKIKMPPFWMSHIAVADVAQTAQLANNNGGKTEVSAQPFGNGNIALIRDPSGAGFTCYDGGDVNAKSSAHGAMVWNELFVPDAEVVRDFYRNVFDWQMLADGGGYFRLTDADGICAASVREVADNMRGNKQYWAIHFAVDSLSRACDTILQCGGTVYDRHEENQCFAASSGGEFFILAE